MRQGLTISALAKQCGVPSKTLRFWESRGLLPRAARTHTGYRVFGPESLRYVAFVRKSKAIGLTLVEIGEILRLARTGHCPCPEVVRWTAERTKSVEEQIQSLTLLLRRLKRIRRQWSQQSRSRGKCGEICYLVESLPEFENPKGEKRYEKTLAHTECCSRDGCCNRLAGDRSRVHVLPSRLPALSMQVSRLGKTKAK